jgi:hypothetical protein
MGRPLISTLDVRLVKIIQSCKHSWHHYSRYSVHFSAVAFLVVFFIRSLNLSFPQQPNITHLSLSFSFSLSLFLSLPHSLLLSYRLTLFSAFLHSIIFTSLHACPPTSREASVRPAIPPRPPPPPPSTSPQRHRHLRVRRRSARACRWRNDARTGAARIRAACR